MEIICAVLEPDAEGMIRVPVPKTFLGGKVSVVATFERALPEPKPFQGSILEAFEELRKAGGFSANIPDPVAWQREQRLDRALPGRD